MPQFKVDLVQMTDIVTQTFEVEANSEEEAREKVEDQYLAGTDLKARGEEYKLVVDMVGTYIPEGPATVDIPEGEVVEPEDAPIVKQPRPESQEEAPAEPQPTRIEVEHQD